MTRPSSHSNKWPPSLGSRWPSTMIAEMPNTKFVESQWKQQTVAGTRLYAATSIIEVLYGCHKCRCSWQFCHVMRHEWSARAMSSDKRGKVAQCTFLLHHLLHSLAHWVAQLTVEFSSCRPTAATRLCPHQSHPSRCEPHWTIVMAISHQVPTTAVAMSHPVLTTAVATPHQVPPPTGCCHRTTS